MTSDVCACDVCGVCACDVCGVCEACGMRSGATTPFEDDANWSRLISFNKKGNEVNWRLNELNEQDER